MKKKNQGSSWGKEKKDYSTKAKPSVEDEPKHVDKKRRIGRSEFKGTCFRCHEEGHRSYEHLQKVGDRRTSIVNEVQDNEPVKGESFLAWQVLFGKKVSKSC